MSDESANKEINRLSNLPPEKRWNSAKHYIFLGIKMPCVKCRVTGCPKRGSSDSCTVEETIFEGVTQELEKEIENLYQKLDVNSFGVQFLIRQIATNTVRLFRAYHRECQEGISSDHPFRIFIPSPIPEYIRRLVNQTMKLLRELGLTPMQQLQKEALIISKSLEMRVSKMYINSAQTQLQKSETELQEKKPTKKEQPIKV